MAIRESDIGTEIRDASSDDADEWVFLVECFAHRILWDDDYSSAGLFLDADPDVANVIRSIMAIDKDHFSAVPPDPLESEIPDILQKLDELSWR